MNLDAPELSEPGGRVFADVRRTGDTLTILHVEADPALRGTGAAGRFMAALVAEAKAQGVSLKPLCSYARAWMARNPS